MDAGTGKGALDAALDKDIAFYCGHGSGDRFVTLRNGGLEHVPCRAVMVLMGCASAHMSDVGEYDPTGAIMRYLLAGAPGELVFIMSEGCSCRGQLMER